MVSFLYYQIRNMIRDWRLSLPIIAIVLLWVHLVAGFAQGYAFNMTESVEGKIFKIREDLPVERGSIVIFPWSDPILPDGVEHMTKHVMCLPGDMLERRGLVFYCNGNRITEAKSHTRSGDPLTLFNWDVGRIPDGVFFAATPHPDGYDSRYYGFVPLASAKVLERTL